MTTDKPEDKAVVGGLNSPEYARLLGVVDSFRALGISKEISLPQLVVVGDQSSGKSSLLEGLTGFQFPTHSGLCTRFATRIILRPAEAEDIKVSIIPSTSSINNESRRKTLLAFKPKLESRDLLGENFAKVMDEAAVAMGLPSIYPKDGYTSTKDFSDDLFSIEVSGPEHHQHLSIVDVPGLFHSADDAQSEDDLKIIRGMIESYMVEKRTIMLTVMDALHNLANQEIFKMAKAADEHGERTVGVITKSDVVAAGDEKDILILGHNNNKTHKFVHGWFAVRNLSTQEKNDKVSMKRRYELEVEHFKRSPWSRLPKDRVGVPALKTRLASILFQHIRKEFPLLLNEIRSKLEETRKDIEGYGESRTTSAEQRHFLTPIANIYQTNNANASRGVYRPMLRPQDPRKLRMHIRMENEKFDSKIKLEGHRYQFKIVEDVNEGQVPNVARVESGTDTRGGMSGAEPSQTIILEKLSKADTALDSDYESDEGSIVSKPLDIYDWIRVVYGMSRGTELPGTVNPAVLEALFREQAAQWGPIARAYLDSVDKKVCRYIKRSFQDLVSDPSVRQKLDMRHERVMEAAKKLASVHLTQLLKDELGGFLMTMNNYFAENLDKNRRARQLIKLKKQSKLMRANNVGEDEGDKYYDGMIRETHLSNDESAVHDIHDTLKAYYKVAVKRFIDNVVLQVTERHYMGEDGPLAFFSPTYIGKLSDEDLNALAGESEDRTTARNTLIKLLHQLEEAVRLGDNL